MAREAEDTRSVVGRWILLFVFKRGLPSLRLALSFFYKFVCVCVCKVKERREARRSDINCTLLTGIIN